MTKAPAPLYLTAERIAASDGYVPSLDGLRAISILFVMVGHLVSGKLAPAGFGVEVFFVISGFLIARLMFAEHKSSGAVSLPRFYLRRFLRLYPVTLVYSTVIVGVFLAAGMVFRWGELWSVLGYYSNYYYLWLTKSHAGGWGLPFGIFWSLAVEEHFYLMFPPLFLLLRGRADRLFWAMLAACVTVLTARLGFGLTHPEMVGFRDLYYRTEFRIDAIAWGVLLAAACETDWGQRRLRALGDPKWFGAALVGLFATFAIRDPLFRDTWRYSLQGLTLAMLFAAILFSPRYRLAQQALNLAPAVWIGRLSYSLYVWHLCTPALSRWLLPHQSWAVQTASQLVLSFVFAAMSFYLLEQPIGRLRRRLGGMKPPKTARDEAAAYPLGAPLPSNP